MCCLFPHWACASPDPRQVLKWCLGSTVVGGQYGAVSALSFNKDCTRLICGFANGQVGSTKAALYIGQQGIYMSRVQPRTLHAPPQKK